MNSSDCILDLQQHLLLCTEAFKWMVADFVTRKCLFVSTAEQFFTSLTTLLPSPDGRMTFGPPPAWLAKDPEVSKHFN